MANLYGVANPAGIPQQVLLIGGANIVCPAGAETNVYQLGPVVAPSNGYFYPAAWLMLYLTLGATPPTALNISLRINNGADLTFIGFNAATLTASASFYCYSALFGTASQTPWQGAGSNIQVAVGTTGQPVTAVYGGSASWIGLMRAPDQ